MSRRLGVPPAAQRGTRRSVGPLGEYSANLDIAVQAHRRDTRCWKRRPLRRRVLPIVKSALIREPLGSDNDMQRLP